MADPFSLDEWRSSREPKTNPQPARAAPGGNVVAMKHIHLETVMDTVRVLRLNKDTTILDRYNRDR